MFLCPGKLQIHSCSLALHALSLMPPHCTPAQPAPERSTHLPLPPPKTVVSPHFVFYQVEFYVSAVVWVLLPPPIPATSRTSQIMGKYAIVIGINYTKTPSVQRTSLMFPNFCIMPSFACLTSCAQYHKLLRQVQSTSTDMPCVDPPPLF